MGFDVKSFERSPYFYRRIDWLSDNELEQVIVKYHGSCLFEYKHGLESDYKVNGGKFSLFYG